jgi:hypothetical protein
MSESHKLRGTRPPKAGRPWAPAEDEVVRSLLAAEAVKVLAGRSLGTVYFRRSQLQLPDGRRKENRG